MKKTKKCSFTERQRREHWKKIS